MEKILKLIPPATLFALAAAAVHALPPAWQPWFWPALSALVLLAKIALGEPKQDDHAWRRIAFALLELGDWAVVNSDTIKSKRAASLRPPAPKSERMDYEP